MKYNLCGGELYVDLYANFQEEMASINLVIAFKLFSIDNTANRDPPLLSKSAGIVLIWRNEKNTINVLPYRAKFSQTKGIKSFGGD